MGRRFTPVVAFAALLALHAACGAVGDQTLAWGGFSGARATLSVGGRELTRQGAAQTVNLQQCEQLVVNNNGGFHNMYNVSSAAFSSCTFTGSEPKLAATSFSSYTFARVSRWRAL
jgi:hypothetical protein